MFAATKSRSASSSTMQASFPPSSIWSGIMPAFFEIATPVSPPVKLRTKYANLGWICNHQEGRNKCKCITTNLQEDELVSPYTVHPRMHCKEVTNFRAFPSNTADNAFWKTGQVKAMHHMKSRYSALQEG